MRSVRTVSIEPVLPVNLNFLDKDTGQININNYNMGVWHITLPNLGCLGDSTPVRVRDFLLPLQAATPKLFEYNEYMASNHPITVSYHTCPILMHESTVSNVVLLIGGPTDIGGWSAPSPKATNVVQGWYFQVQFIIFGKSVAYTFFDSLQIANFQYI